MTSAGDGNVIRDVLIVDISDFENRKHEIGRQLYHASHNVGFFYIKGHDVPNKDINSIFNAGEQFLNLPADVKERFVWVPDRYLGWRSQSGLESVTGSLSKQHIAPFIRLRVRLQRLFHLSYLSAGNKLWEWVSFGRYGTGGYDVRKQKFLGSSWPTELGDSWKEQSLEFQAKTHEVALKILRAMALALGRDEYEFVEVCSMYANNNFMLLADKLKVASFMAWNWYPPVGEDTAKLPPRLHGHADMDIITLLYQHTGDTGLEIAPGKDVDEDPDLKEIGNAWNAVPTAKHWTPIDPIEGCITVNIGDGLQWWTDGLFKSTYHRVRAPKGGDNRGSRMSVPYFVNPKLNYVFQGPEKKFPPLSGFDLLAKTGNAYEARKNDSEGKWREKAYGDAHRNGQYASVEGAKGRETAVPVAAA